MTTDQWDIDYVIMHSWKYWQGIKFGIILLLAVGKKTTKLNSTNTLLKDYCNGQL